MNFKFIGISFVVFLFVYFIPGIYGRNIIPTEMQQRKAAIQTVKSVHGDIYDCVDIMKQPSLQEQPSFVSHHKQKEILQRIMREKNKKIDDKWKRKIWIGEGCPNGTVPIPQKNGRHKLSHNFTKTTANQSITDDNYNGGYDVVGIIVEQGGLKGAFSTISIHHPDGVLSGQYSSARVRLETYNGYTEEFVEAGWTVNPDLYSDDKTRLYTRWQGVNNAGCYNTDCLGFVITDTQYPINYAFPQISDPWTGEHHDVDIDIQIGDQDKNWYLKINGVLIGYWRGDIFQNLATASAIVFAGEVYSKPPTRDSPPMGSGQYKGNNEVRTAYMKNMQVRLDQFFVPPPSYRLADRSRCYLAGWESYSGSVLYGFNFLFGGTGGRSRATCLDPNS